MTNFIVPHANPPSPGQSAADVVVANIDPSSAGEGLRRKNDVAGLEVSTPYSMMRSTEAIAFFMIVVGSSGLAWNDISIESSGPNAP